MFDPIEPMPPPLRKILYVKSLTKLRLSLGYKASSSSSLFSLSFRRRWIFVGIADNRSSEDTSFAISSSLNPIFM